MSHNNAQSVSQQAQAREELEQDIINKIRFMTIGDALKSSAHPWLMQHICHFISKAYKDTYLAN